MLMVNLFQLLQEFVFTLQELDYYHPNDTYTRNGLMSSEE
jgi:hypothetical protein